MKELQSGYKYFNNTNLRIIGHIKKSFYIILGLNSQSLKRALDFHFGPHWG